jgi:hypothetical protein
MPELLAEGLPAQAARRRFDFARWADGQAWRFVKGQDYTSSTETFRVNVRRWARDNGYEVELRAYPAVDGDGREIPLSKRDGIALGVRFYTANGSTGDKA